MQPLCRRRAPSGPATSVHASALTKALTTWSRSERRSRRQTVSALRPATLLITWSRAYASVGAETNGCDCDSDGDCVMGKLESRSRSEPRLIPLSLCASSSGLRPRRGRPSDWPGPWPGSSRSGSSSSAGGGRASLGRRSGMGRGGLFLGLLCAHTVLAREMSCINSTYKFRNSEHLFVLSTNLYFVHPCSRCRPPRGKVPQRIPSESSKTMAPPPRPPNPEVRDACRSGDIPRIRAILAADPKALQKPCPSRPNASRCQPSSCTTRSAVAQTRGAPSCSPRRRRRRRQPGKRERGDAAARRVPSGAHGRGRAPGAPRRLPPGEGPERLHPARRGEAGWICAARLGPARALRRDPRVARAAALRRAPPCAPSRLGGCRRPRHGSRAPRRARSRLKRRSARARRRERELRCKWGPAHAGSSRRRGHSPVAGRDLPRAGGDGRTAPRPPGLAPLRAAAAMLLLLSVL